jgi:hypothetical protein
MIRVLTGPRRPRRTQIGAATSLIALQPTSVQIGGIVRLGMSRDDH